MKNIVNELIKELKKLDTYLEKIDKFLVTAPRGSLNYKTDNNIVYYYHQASGESAQEIINVEMSKFDNSNKVKASKKVRHRKGIKVSNDSEVNNNSEDNNVLECNNNAEDNNDLETNKDVEKTDARISNNAEVNNNVSPNDNADKMLGKKQFPNKQRYIKRKEESLARALAQKAYYLSIKPTIEKQRNNLALFLSRYREVNEKEFYGKLCDARKVLVEPLDNQLEQILKRWNEEKSEGNDYHNENKIYETNQGELVRSKSETLIANMLYEHQEDILYKYEMPLDIRVSGRVKTIYPDFTILNKNTGKITYLEHAGRMDDPEYANTLIKKINNYVLNGIMPGEDLIITYESSEYPLDIKVVRTMVYSLINE